MLIVKAGVMWNVVIAMELGIGDAVIVQETDGWNASLVVKVEK